MWFLVDEHFIIQSWLLKVYGFWVAFLCRFELMGNLFVLSMPEIEVLFKIYIASEGFLMLLGSFMDSFSSVKLVIHYWKFCDSRCLGVGL